MFPWAILIVLSLTIVLIKIGWFWRVFNVVGFLCFLSLMIDIFDAVFHPGWHKGIYFNPIIIIIQLVWIFRVTKRLWMSPPIEQLPEKELEQPGREF